MLAKINVEIDAQLILKALAHYHNLLHQFYGGEKKYRFSCQFSTEYGLAEIILHCSDEYGDLLYFTHVYNHQTAPDLSVPQIINLVTDHVEGLMKDVKTEAT